MTGVPEPRLPLWRLLAALVVLGGMAAVLLALAPVYLDNWRLQGFVRELMRSPGAGAMTDDSLENDILSRSHQLNLPVQASDIHIVHVDGKLKVDMKYAVQKDFNLYQVDLHFHPNASSR